MKITNQKISKKEALKLYSDLIIPDIAALKKIKKVISKIGGITF